MKKIITKNQLQKLTVDAKASKNLISEILIENFIDNLINKKLAKIAIKGKAQAIIKIAKKWNINDIEYALNVYYGFKTEIVKKNKVLIDWATKCPTIKEKYWN